MFMAYESVIKEVVVETLKDRVSTTAGYIDSLLKGGYIPNKAKLRFISIAPFIIRAYDNIDIFTEEQQKKLDNLFNKLIT